MKKRSLRLLACSSVLCITSITINAAPIFENSLISNSHLDYTAGIFDTSMHVTTSLVSNPMAGVAAKGDLSTGKVGALATSQTAPQESIIQLFDVLTFSTATTVSFDFVLEGILATDRISNSPTGRARVDIYDITGLPYWLETEEVFGLFDQVGVRDEAVEVSINSMYVSMNGTGIFNSGRNSDDFYDLPRDGAFNNFQYTISEAFEVDPNKEYGIRISANAFNEGAGAYSDFNNSGTFSFSDLGGAEFTSASGTFLSATAIDEPALHFMLLLSVFALFRTHKLRKLIKV